MRVLFSASEWPGHYFPMLPLARHLRDSGHEVRVLCAESQAGHVTSAGLAADPVLEGLDMVFQTRLSQYWRAQAGGWPHPWLPPHPVTGEHLRSLDDFDLAAYRQQHKAATLAATRRSFGAAVTLARTWQPDLVIHDRLSLEGLLAARVTGVPAVAYLWGPVGTAEEGQLRLIPGDPTGSFPRYGVGELGAEPFRYVIDPCPDDLEPPVGSAARMRVQYIPFSGRAFGSAPPPGTGQPRVCLVWSTALTAMTGPRSFLVPTVLDALSGLDLDVITLLNPPDAERLGAWPGVQVATDVALERALATADMVIHHGGAGCTMTSVTCGVPQLQLTLHEEAAANSARVAAAGASRHIPGEHVTPERLRAAVTALISEPSYRARARWLAAQNETRPGLAALTGQLTELASQRPAVAC